MKKNNMCGIELSEKFFNDILLKKIKEKLNIPIAAGLIGYGSECYGFDDNISKDHDFYAMPCIWLKHEDYITYNKEIEEILNSLPKEYENFKVMDESVWGKNRRGIIDIDEYIYSFLGSNKGPKEDIEFRNIPQYLLSAFTNGKIFLDEFGIITSIREKVKFYPNDIRLNMIATRCMTISREGLYNYERCIKRNEYVAANQALSLFITSAFEMYFLIYKKYSPYYKWQHKMLKKLDNKVYNLFSELVLNDTTYNRKINIIDIITNDIIDKLENEDIIVRVTDYLGYYGPIIQSRIKNEKIKNLGCWSD